jgi:hypothetical protein
MNKKNRIYILIIFTFISVSNLLYPQITRKAPYLIYDGNELEMQVIWQLYSTESCQIEWGTDTLYSIGSAQTFEYGSDHQHTYTITNLIPVTKYYYRVIVNQEVHAGTFHSAPTTNASAINFFAYGDTRSNPGIHDQVAAEMVATYTLNNDFQSFIISVGDLVNNGNNESDWDNQFFDPAYVNIQEILASLPYQSCMGNHEGSGVLFSKYFPYPFVDGRYWSFDYGPAHFVVVDQYTSYGPGSGQLTWIGNDLASTTKLWKFIYLHEPGWSAGGGHSNNTSVQNYIQPLCEQYDVSIVFAGHNHYYSRAVVNNIQHITTGGGGAPLHQPNGGYPNVVSTAEEHHFCKVEIDENTLNFTAVTRTGEVIDSFTIEKQPVNTDSKPSQVVSQEYILHSAYPNPFNPITKIKYQIPDQVHNDNVFVTLKIFDVLGNQITELVNEEISAGTYEIYFDAKGFPSGVYFYQLKAGDFSQTKKMLLLR